MKKILLLLLLNTLIFAQGYKEFAKKMGYETNYEIALQRAKNEKKELFIVMITNYCPWCSKFEKKTLSDSKVHRAIKLKYIPLIINKEEKKFPSYLSTTMVPTVFFVKAHEEKSFHESVGFLNKVDFLHLLEQLN